MDGGHDIRDGDERHAAKDLGGLTEIAHDEHIPDDESDGGDEEFPAHTHDERASITDGEQVADDHREVDRDHASGDKRTVSDAMLLSNQLDESFAGLMSDARADIEYGQQYGVTEDDHPCDGVSESNASHRRG